MKKRNYQFISDFNFKSNDKTYTIKSGEILTGVDVGLNSIGFNPSEVIESLSGGEGYFEISKNNKILKDMGTVSEKIKKIDWSKVNPENVESTIQSVQAIMNFAQKSEFDRMLKATCGGKLTGLLSAKKKKDYRDCVAKFMSSNGYTGSGSGIGENTTSKDDNGTPPPPDTFPLWAKIAIGVVVVGGLTTAGIIIYKKYKK